MPSAGSTPTEDEYCRASRLGPGSESTEWKVATDGDRNELVSSDEVEWSSSPWRRRDLCRWWLARAAMLGGRRCEAADDRAGGGAAREDSEAVDGDWRPSDDDDEGMR
jgi:hypothetical protein